MANVRIDTEDGTAIDKNLGEDVEDTVMDFTWRRHQQSNEGEDDAKDEEHDGG